MSSTSFHLAVELRDRLFAELQKNATFRAYQHVQAALAALDARVEQQQPASQQATVAEKTARQSYRSGSQSAAALTGTMEYLRGKGSRAESGEILKALAARGIELRGKKPQATLSSYLSHSALFNNVRGEGYGLAEWSQPLAQTETPNSDELFGAPKLNGAEPMSP